MDSMHAAMVFPREENIPIANGFPRCEQIQYKTYEQTNKTYEKNFFEYSFCQAIILNKYVAETANS